MPRPLRISSCVVWITLFLSISASAQRQVRYDLYTLTEKGKMEVFNRELTTFTEDGRKAVRLSKALGEGVAWLPEVDFKQGTIEVDIRGEDVRQRSFVGIAFHGRDSNTFDAVYVRPFNFRAQDEVAKSHGVQYISLPDFTWRTLREKFPNVYESAVVPAPDPNAWLHLKMVVEGNRVLTFINGSNEPSLVVTKVSANLSGKIGLYVADTSGGDFANLVITPKR